MKIYLMGYPGDLGGACTEAWHTVKLWRRFGVDVHLIPTWGCSSKWQERCDQLGCVTLETTPEKLGEVDGLPGSIVVSFCNAAFLQQAKRLRELGCKLVWSNCMTWLFDAEREFNRQFGPFDAYHFQSEFQRSLLEPQLAEFGYQPTQGHLIRGAFDVDEWEFSPRSRSPDEPFVIGRAARPDRDKWSSNTWPIYRRIQVKEKRALMLGMDDSTHQKLGKPPDWAECLTPMAIPAQEFYRRIHCQLPVNGGARENWPRVGLEAMAAGVPIVAQAQWGWAEMIEHGVTGFLGSCDQELAHYAAVLSYDEDLRREMIVAARQRLCNELAHPETLWRGWRELFESLGQRQETQNSDSSGFCLLDRNVVGAGVHRSGWPKVVANLRREASITGTRLDDFTDASFSYLPLAKPHTEHWVGIFHHPVHVNSPLGCDGKHVLRAIEANPMWQASLPSLRGVVALCEEVASDLREWLNVPTISIRHPTAVDVPRWQPKAAIDVKRLVGAGFCLRNTQLMYQFEAPDWRRVQLFGASEWYRARDVALQQLSVRPRIKPEEVELQGRLEDEAYDDLLSASVIVTELYGAAANNLIVECMARGTPVLVNRLPAVEEYLGHDYPLFYEDIAEIPNLLKRDRLLAASEQLLSRRQLLPTFEEFAERVGDFIASLT